MVTNFLEDFLSSLSLISVFILQINLFYDFLVFTFGRLCERSLQLTFYKLRFISWAHLAEMRRLVGLLKRIKLTCQFRQESLEALWCFVSAAG